VAVLHAYMDETGTHGTSPVIAVGMYVGRPQTWREWTKDWNKHKKPIKIFHAVDCSNRAGEFEGWTRERRNAYAAKLLPVLPRHQIFGLAVGIHMNAFRSAMAPHPELREMFGEPYTACFQWSVQTLLEMLDERGEALREKAGATTVRNPPVAFFHECNDYQQEAQAAFAYVKTLKVTHARQISLTFGDKDAFVPLQAADALAYEVNHLVRDFSKTNRPSWHAINPGATAHGSTGRVRILTYSERNMDGLISRLSAHRQKLLASGWDGKVVWK
jgi:hypothetical protein